jgi:hypothetical protein
VNGPSEGFVMWKELQYRVARILARLRLWEAHSHARIAGWPKRFIAGVYST